MDKLNFEWHDSRDRVEYRADVGGLIVRAIQDSDAGNPWKSFDNEPPLIVYHDRSIERLGGDIDPLADVSDSWIARHWRRLCEIFDAPPDAAQERKKNHGYFKIADARRDLLDEWLDDIRPSRFCGHAGEYMKAVKALCELRGWPFAEVTSRGYSQGDYAELLLVFTPDYAAKIGAAWPRSAKAKAKAVNSLEAAGKLWTAWAWGDVYGYVIESPEGDCLYSVWGFYGSDFEWSGLAGAAAESLAHIRQERRERRAKRLKELIRARVPLAARAAIMEGFPL